LKKCKNSKNGGGNKIEKRKFKIKTNFFFFFFECRRRRRRRCTAR